MTVEPLEVCMVQGQHSSSGTEQGKGRMSPRESVIPDESFPQSCSDVSESEEFNYVLQELKKYNLNLDQPYINIH